MFAAAIAEAPLLAVDQLVLLATAIVLLAAVLDAMVAGLVVTMQGVIVKLFLGSINGGTHLLGELNLD